MHKSDKILYDLFRKATKYPTGKTRVCRGNECNKPATGGGLFCNNCADKASSGILTTKSPENKPQYVDKMTQNKIWNDNKKASIGEDIFGATSAVMDSFKFKEPSENVRHGLPERKAYMSDEILKNFFKNN